MKTFWDFCARFYDFAQLQNSAYKRAVDFVLAPQVLHLLDNPQKAALELRRICAKKVILPQTLLKEISLFARLKVRIWKILGFAPKIDLDFAEYKKFLEEMGFENCVVTYFKSDMPMAVAVCDVKASLSHRVG